MNSEGNFFAHKTAVIDEGCTIGEGVKVWRFSHIMPNNVIGPKFNIGQNVVISPEVILGTNVKVQNNVSIYTGVICEDDVVVMPSGFTSKIKTTRPLMIDEYRENRITGSFTLVDDTIHETVAAGMIM